MTIAQRPFRLITGLATLLACAAGLAGGAAAQIRYEDPRNDERYEDERRYDPRDRYDERDRYDDRDRSDDRAASSGGDYDEDDPARSFEELDRHGEWRNHPEYGRVWFPEVPDNWRPYTRGYWVNTEEHGWYWESEEPFGWATFHYGRWFFDEDEGSWAWVPGNVWGPAWVAWREGEEEMGWAPLPPNAYWYPDRGLVLGSDFYTSPRWAPFWIFASPRYMTTPGLYRYVSPRSRSTYYFARTEPRHNHYRYSDRRIYNGGISVARVERFGGRPVPAVRINVVSSFRDQGMRGGGRQVVNVYRPQRVEAARTNRWRTNYTRPDSPRGTEAGRSGGPAPGQRFDGRNDRNESWRNRDQQPPPGRGGATARVPETQSPSPSPRQGETRDRRDWFARENGREGGRDLRQQPRDSGEPAQRSGGRAAPVVSTPPPRAEQRETRPPQVEQRPPRDAGASPQHRQPATQGQQPGRGGEHKRDQGQPQQQPRG